MVVLEWRAVVLFTNTISIVFAWKEEDLGPLEDQVPNSYATHCKTKRWTMTTLLDVPPEVGTCCTRWLFVVTAHFPRTLLLFWLSVTKRRTPLKMMFGSFRRNIKFAVDVQEESQRSTMVDAGFQGLASSTSTYSGWLSVCPVPSHLRTRSRRISLRIDCFLLR